MTMQWTCGCNSSICVHVWSTAITPGLAPRLVRDTAASVSAAALMSNG